MSLTTISPEVLLEVILIVVVVMLGMLAVAASAQAYLFHKLIRELARAYEDLEATRVSANRVLQDMAVVTGTASMVVTKGKDGIGAFYEAAETVRILVSEVRSFVTALLDLGGDMAGSGRQKDRAESGKGGDLADQRTSSDAHPNAAPT